jgi:hypothetical protein
MSTPKGTGMSEKKRDAVRRLIARHTRLTTVDRETARASLVRDGIYTRDGQLAPEYRRYRKAAP